MTSSSTEPAVVRDFEGSPMSIPALDGNLRTGTWTRLGGSAVLGDSVTESMLNGLAETARAAARAQGYAVGWSEGRQAGEQDARGRAAQEEQERAAERERQAAEHQQAVAALRRAAQALQGALAEVSAAVEDRAVDVALQLTEAVLGREVALAAEPAADAMRRALALLPAGAAVTVRLHPSARATVDVAEFGEFAVRMVDDPSLGRADAVVETDTAVVDATVAAALQRVREVLAP